MPLHLFKVELMQLKEAIMNLRKADIDEKNASDLSRELNHRKSIDRTSLGTGELVILNKKSN